MNPSSVLLHSHDCTGNCCLSAARHHGAIQKSALLWAERGMARILADGELRWFSVLLDRIEYD